jgi:quercetin dioxygenase-like cupin family protein
MIIRNILAELSGSVRPVARIIKASSTFKSIAIGLNTGMIWPDHKAPLPTTLLVAEGSVIYREQNRVVTLHKHDDFEIPVDVKHSLEALTDSICILIQG